MAPADAQAIARRLVAEAVAAGRLPERVPPEVTARTAAALRALPKRKAPALAQASKPSPAVCESAGAANTAAREEVHGEYAPLRSYP